MFEGVAQLLGHDGVSQPCADRVDPRRPITTPAATRRSNTRPNDPRLCHTPVLDIVLRSIEHIFDDPSPPEARMGTVHAFPGQQFRGSQPRGTQLRAAPFRGSPVGGSSRGGPAPRVAPVERRPVAVRGPSAHRLPAERGNSAGRRPSVPPGGPRSTRRGPGRPATARTPPAPPPPRPTPRGRVVGPGGARGRPGVPRAGRPRPAPPRPGRRCG